MVAEYDLSIDGFKGELLSVYSSRHSPYKNSSCIYFGNDYYSHSQFEIDSHLLQIK